ncbi:MAG: hypothetical protein B7Y25_00180 [Alphaproteobacteria bacterium 16-39-46]|nr:MAG: hypothetical protein B7Y25_00180 [Alphaproteobacteria bacterium 16-39-46]OZA44526.1 MAG: hypothetical protein B7X84_00140 [Alphaproteobacteria bacterium 17-39-52]HQS83372.1 Smr/MutS family protein [Alphaproteobacteria bacterium]HQS93059.1 Smr/MutS family protein [Alphaproteobacteria bacterium]
MASKKTPASSTSLSFLLTEDEKKLLKKFQKTITPLKKNRIEFSSCLLSDASEKISFSKASHPQRASIVVSQNNTPPQKTISDDTPLPPLEKHTARKVKSKHHSFSATLDLHGLSQERAYEKLISFIETNHQKNRRSLLIITGKGQGILKKSLLVWLQSTSLRPLIASVELSLPHHGGEGAFYVILRKKKEFS